MNVQTNIPSIEGSFKDFLLKNKRNRIILWLAAVAIVVQYSVFKYFYPFASYIYGDSFSYLKAADLNLTINTYLIGYSKFLRLFSVFAKSDLILTLFQYLFIQASALFLLFTFFYFYNIKKPVQIALLIISILNPLFLHLANLISSDGFFLGLSLIWFALLIWITYKPSKRNIIWHAIVLFIAFTTRYNAIIYPLVSICAFLISNLRLRHKIISISFSLLLCVSFIVFTSYQYKKLTGHWQYSPFSGWQFANNAMYAYRYVHKADRKPVPKTFEKLDQMIREYFDSTRDTNRFYIEKVKASTFYMWSPSLPLMKYREQIFKNDTSATDLKKWATMGPLYKDYGLFIIKQYPGYFLKHFIWPNATKYYAPPIEFLESYNSWNSEVTPRAVKWFGYNSTTIKPKFKNYKTWILDFYPILSGIINVVMLLSLISYLLLKGWSIDANFNKIIIVGTILWLTNAVFTIFASSAALRFQSFPIIITWSYVILLIDWMFGLIRTMKKLSLTDTSIDTKSKIIKEVIA
jgi:hypothetical protein